MRMVVSPCERSSLGHVLISLIYSHTGYVCSCEHDGFYFKEMPQHVVGVQPPIFSWHPTRPTGPDKRRISNLNSALWQWGHSNPFSLQNNHYSKFIVKNVRGEGSMLEDVDVTYTPCTVHTYWYATAKDVQPVSPRAQPAAGLSNMDADCLTHGYELKRVVAQMGFVSEAHRAMGHASGTNPWAERNQTESSDIIRRDHLQSGFASAPFTDQTGGSQQVTTNKENNEPKTEKSRLAQQSQYVWWELPSFRNPGCLGWFTRKTLILCNDGPLTHYSLILIFAFFLGITCYFREGGLK